MSAKIARREFITLLGGAAAAWPLAARGQQSGRTRPVGVLMNGASSDPFNRALLAGFVEGLEDLGWKDNQNLHIELRWSAGDAERARAYAVELVGLGPTRSWLSPR
jgi:putative ABC transport system substrate-binding protein